MNQLFSLQDIIRFITSNIEYVSKMSRFLTSIQLIGSLGVAILLLMARNSEGLDGNAMLEMAGYGAIITGAFLLTIQLLSSKFSSQNFSGKLSFIFRILLILIGAVLLEPRIASFMEIFISDVTQTMLLISVIIFILTLFFVSSRTKKSAREFESMAFKERIRRRR